MNVNLIINEEVKRLFEQNKYSIPELGKFLSRMGHDNENQDILTSILINAFKHGGDDAVIETYAEISGVEIEAISNGRYIFANLHDPEAINF